MAMTCTYWNLYFLKIPNIVPNCQYTLSRSRYVDYERNTPNILITLKINLHFVSCVNTMHLLRRYVHKYSTLVFDRLFSAVNSWQPIFVACRIGGGIGSGEGKGAVIALWRILGRRGSVLRCMTWRSNAPARVAPGPRPRRFVTSRLLTTLTCPRRTHWYCLLSADLHTSPRIQGLLPFQGIWGI